VDINLYSIQTYKRQKPRPKRGDATGEGRNSVVWWIQARTLEDCRGDILSSHHFPRELERFPGGGAAGRVASPLKICDEVITAAAEQRRREPQHGQGDQAVLQGGDADPPDEEEFPPGLALFVPSWIVLNVPPSCSLLLLAVSRKKRLPMLVSTSPLNLVSQHFSSLSSLLLSPPPSFSDFVFSFLHLHFSPLSETRRAPKHGRLLSCPSTSTRL
jgi:hypothetical protein